MQVLAAFGVFSGMDVRRNALWSAGRGRRE